MKLLKMYRNLNFYAFKQIVISFVNTSLVFVLLIIYTCINLFLTPVIVLRVKISLVFS